MSLKSHIFILVSGPCGLNCCSDYGGTTVQLEDKECHYVCLPHLC